MKSDLTRADLLSDWSLLHLAWFRAAQSRYLLFGWLEHMPADVPIQDGHPFVSYKLGETEALHVSRFPLSRDESLQWLDKARTGQVNLPKHPDATTSGDLAPLETINLRREPLVQSGVLSMELPFLPYLHSAAHFYLLQGDVIPTITKVLGEQNEPRQWLQDWLFFDVMSYPEYLGSLAVTHYDPLIRSVDTRLFPGEKGTQAIRLCTWPSAPPEKLMLCGVERRNSGISPLQWAEIQDNMTQITWPHQPGQIALVILDEKRALRWHTQPATFIKEIRLEVNMIASQKRVEVRTEHGALLDSFIAPTLVSETISQGTPQVDRSQQRFTGAQSHREQLQLAKSMGLRWLDDKVVAAGVIREIISGARNRVLIIDPYFGAAELARFGPFCTQAHVSIEIWTSAELLRGKGGEGTRLLNAHVELTKHAPSRVSIYVMKGKRAPVHDRFLVVDDKVWLSGNSLTDIGHRASVLVQLPDPTFVSERLDTYRSTLVLLSDWIDQHKQNKTE